MNANNKVEKTVILGESLEGPRHALRVSLTPRAAAAADEVGLANLWIRRAGDLVHLYRLESVIAAGLGWGLGPIREAPAGAEALLARRLAVAARQPPPPGDVTEARQLYLDWKLAGDGPGPDWAELTLPVRRRWIRLATETLDRSWRAARLARLAAGWAPAEAP